MSRTIYQWLADNPKISINELLFAIKFLFKVNIEEDCAKSIYISEKMYKYIEENIEQQQSARKRGDRFFFKPSLEQYAKLFDTIYVDTCFMMHSKLDEFCFFDRLSMYAKKYNNKIIVIDKVLGELKENRNKKNKKDADIASEAFDHIEMLFHSDVLRSYPEVNVYHADQDFHEILIHFRPKYAALVLTDDSDLKNFVYNLNSSAYKSSRGYLATCFTYNSKFCMDEYEYKLDKKRLYNYFSDYSSSQSDEQYTAYFRNPYCIRCGKTIEDASRGVFCRECASYLGSVYLGSTFLEIEESIFTNHDTLE